MKRNRFLSGLLTVAMLCSMFLPIGTQAAPTPTPIKAADGLVNEDNAAFLWTGTWADQAAADRHGGASKWTNTDGSAVEVLFEGQGITFYSTKRADAGEYKVYLDGVYQGKGTLKADPLPKQIAYSVFGLENGVHRLKICTVGAVILEADAAEVLSADPGLTTAVAVTAAGDAEKITAPGGTLQMTATTVPAAQSVRWTVTDGKGAPTTAASIDGAGLLTAKTNGVVLVTATATDGSLKSGTKPVSISGQTVGGEKWDDQDTTKLTYGAGWASWGGDPAHYNGTTMYSNGTPGNTLTFSFTGTGFKVIGVKNAALSSFSVSVDGTEVAADVSANGTLAYQQELYVSGTLTDGTHQVVITDKGQIYIDAIEISYAPPAIAAITAAEPLAAVEVPVGTAFEDLNLPTTVNVTAGGASVPMDIYWEKGSYNPAQAGEYNLSG
ncbi:MAG: Ig-like domain-containing protein, partial [Oscillospiraceae bacterium]